MCYDLTHALPGRAAPPVASRTSSRSSSPAARTTAWPPSPAPTCRSSAPGRTTSGRTTRRLREYAADGLDIQKDVCDRCPTTCMSWDGKHARHRQPRVRPLHALHQRDAEGAAARQGAGRDAPHRLQGADRAGRAALLGARPLRPGRRAGRHDQGAARRASGSSGTSTARTASGSASSSSASAWPISWTRSGSTRCRRWSRRRATTRTSSIRSPTKSSSPFPAGRPTEGAEETCR